MRDILEMDIEWDPTKSEENLRKHGLAFEDACRVFAEPMWVADDDRKAYGETRTIALGVLEGRVVVMVYTQRGTKTRVISMRKANEREQKRYQERLRTTRQDA